MESDKTRFLSLHLIKEDLKYHQMVAVYAMVEVRFEFAPDLATVVKSLLGQEGAEDDWGHHYTTAIAKC